MEFVLAMLLIVGGSYLIAAMVRLVPFAQDFGGDVLVVVLLPSYLVYAGWITPGVESASRTLLQRSDIIGIFITVLIVGSISAIPRKLLFTGAAKVALPLVFGSLVALAVGVAVGMLFGISPLQTLLFRLLPIMSGGISTGVLPMAVGYGSVLGQGQESFVAMLLPPVIFGNLIAILCGGVLRFSAERHGKMLTSSADISAWTADDNNTMQVARQDIFIAAVILAMFYLVGVGVFLSANVAIPLTVLFIAAILKFSDKMPEQWRRGVVFIYDMVIRFATFPIVFVVGMLFTPWTGIVEGLSAVNLCIIGSAVVTLAATGYCMSRFIVFDRLDGAVVTLTRSAMGGTGALAILVASRRIHLMPFAVISTRIGGAISLAAALLLAGQYGG